MNYNEAPSNLHPAQMQILRELSHNLTSNFSSLRKATALTSDHANFHIKKLIETGYIQHAPKSYGEYKLTAVGKLYSSKLSPDDPIIESQPKVSVVLWVENLEGRVLRQERLCQPFYGYWTRPTGKVRRGETILQAATRKLTDETGLSAELKVVGVEHRIDKAEDGKLLDDKYLFIIRGTNPQGELIAQTNKARNHWMTEQEYNSKSKRFGNPKSQVILLNETALVSEGEYTFTEQDY